jgi:hypothetical protein
MLGHKIRRAVTGAKVAGDQFLGTKNLPSPTQVTTPNQDQVESPASLPSPAQATKPTEAPIKSPAALPAAAPSALPAAAPAALPAAAPMAEAVHNEKKVNKKTW